MLKKLMILIVLAVAAITMTAKVAVAGDCPNCATASPQGVVVSPQSPIIASPIFAAPAPYAYPAPCVACAPKKKCCLSLPKLKLPKCDMKGKLHGMKTKVCSLIPKPKLFSKKVPCHTTWPTGCASCGDGAYIAGPQIIAGPAPIYGAPQSVAAPLASGQFVEAPPAHGPSIVADSAPVFSAPTTSAPAPASPLPLPTPNGGH